MAAVLGRRPAAGVDLLYPGIYADGKLQYRYAEARAPDGTRFLRRLAFFNLDPDNVRQLAERSNDGGGTWVTEYDFHYTRRH